MHAYAICSRILCYTRIYIIDIIYAYAAPYKTLLIEEHALHQIVNVQTFFSHIREIQKNGEDEYFNSNKFSRTSCPLFVCASHHVRFVYLSIQLKCMRQCNVSLLLILLHHHHCSCNLAPYTNVHTYIFIHLAHIQCKHTHTHEHTDTLNDYWPGHQVYFKINKIALFEEK